MRLKRCCEGADLIGRRRLYHFVVVAMADAQIERKGTLYPKIKSIKKGCDFLKCNKCFASLNFSPVILKIMQTSKYTGSINGASDERSKRHLGFWGKLSL